MTSIYRLSVCFIFVTVICSISLSQEYTNKNADQAFLEVNRQQTLQEEKIEAAFVAMDAVQKVGAYIESLSDLIDNGEITLPVGLKKGDYELIIHRIKFNKETGRPVIYGICAFEFKDDGQKIAFEGSAELEGQKGLGTQGSFTLIEPVSRKLGEKVALIFKDKTRVNFGCQGIESFTAFVDLIVTSENIIAVDNAGKTSEFPLSASFSTEFHDFDNYTASFSFNQSFYFRGLKDIIFTLNGASLDQSDITTSKLIVFPSNYFQADSQEEKNIWKGISVSEASVALPAVFKKSSVSNDSLLVENDSISPFSSDRIVLGVSNLIIDDNGFSGLVSAKDVMVSNALDPNKWDISLTDLMLNITKDDISGFGFGGDMNLPPLGKNSLIPYKAIFNPALEEYEFQAGITGQYEFPIFKSTLILDETSVIDVYMLENEIYPSIRATGLLTVNAPVNQEDTTKKFSVPDISFQNMVISRKSPHYDVEVMGITGELRSPRVAGFELTVTGFEAFKDDSLSGMRLDANVNLNEVFGGNTSIYLYGNYNKWKFNRVAIGEVGVYYDSDPFLIQGSVAFKNGDLVYGDGFRGKLKIKLLKKDEFEFDAVGVFGKKDDYRYFLTDVFYETSPKTGLPVGPLTFYGVGGGLYRHMQQTFDPSVKSDFGQSLSGINYIPDNEVGMGFMTATKFCLAATPTAFNAKVGFEMQFNRFGGLNFIQLRGDASFMDDPDKWGALADNINEKVKKISETEGAITLAAKSDLAVPENKTSGFLTASLLINYDIAHKVFSADLNTYLDAGFLTGIGPNNRMGWASAYFSEDKWYTYIGTPGDRLGIDILGLARANAYFMVGDDIPELPLPPSEVLVNFSQEKQDKLNTRDNSLLTSGKGLAFGAGLGVTFEAKLTPFYAGLNVGMGAEFLLKSYGSEAYCSGSTTTLGINGWYARAQAWAYVQADIGMEAKVFTKPRRFSILDVTAGALLAGAGPNPYYFTGMVGGSFNVLGGLISGQCEFDFEIGEECIIKGGSPFGEDIIRELTPASGEREVNVFASPQAVFTIPVGVEMEIEEEEGQKAMYKITLEEFSVSYKDSKQKVSGYSDLTTDGRVFMLDPSEPFESEKDIVVFAKVGFKRKLNDQWIDVKGSDGKPLFETKEAVFSSGERPKVILPEHVKYSYPVYGQYNFYPGEYKGGGYIMATENYTYLFTTDKPEGFNQKLRISDLSQNKSEANFTFTTFPAGNEIRFEIDFATDFLEYSADEIYKLSIVNIPQSTGQNITSNINTTETNLDDNDSIKVTKSDAEGTLEMLEEKEIYALHFRTSTYNTFDEKVAAITNYEGVSWQEYPHIYLLGSVLYDGTTPTELFEQLESSSLNADMNMIQIQPVYDKTDWYDEVANLIYNNSDVLRSANMIGLKPPEHSEVIKIAMRTPDTRLNQDIIGSNSRPYVSPFGGIHNRSSYYVDRDFYTLRNELANRLPESGARSSGLNRFLQADNIPDLTRGDYTMLINYTLPGKNIVTSSVERKIVLDKL